MNPINPKIIKIELDINSTILGFSLFPKSFPKNKAMELLRTIPVIEPSIKDNL